MEVTINSLSFETRMFTFAKGTWIRHGRLSKSPIMYATTCEKADRGVNRDLCSDYLLVVVANENYAVATVKVEMSVNIVCCTAQKI